MDAWAALAGAPVGDRVVVSDWGGDWTGLDTAEMLAARGAQVRLVTSAMAFGEGIHQYQRNLYLERLDNAGVELSHHLRPVSVAPGSATFENVFSGNRSRPSGVDTLVVTAGRTAGDALYLELRGPACRSNGPATARAPARSRRRSARARWPASRPEKSVPGTNFHGE